MTANEFPTTWRGRIVEIAKVLSAVAVIVSVLVGGWAATWGPVAHAWESVEEFIDEVDQLGDRVSSLETVVATLAGEDRVLRQPPGLSYIAEPVRVGDLVVMFLTAARTKLGKDCRLETWVPLFTDERNIPTPGKRIGAGQVNRQIGSEMQRLRIVMEPPAELRPGRIEVYLALDYRCGDEIVSERSLTLPFQLLPAE